MDEKEGDSPQDFGLQDSIETELPADDTEEIPLFSSDASAASQLEALEKEELEDSASDDYEDNPFTFGYENNYNNYRGRYNRGKWEKILPVYTPLFYGEDKTLVGDQIILSSQLLDELSEYFCDLNIIYL